MCFGTPQSKQIICVVTIRLSVNISEKLVSHKFYQIFRSFICIRYCQIVECTSEVSGSDPNKDSTIWRKLSTLRCRYPFEMFESARPPKKEKKKKKKLLKIRTSCMTSTVLASSAKLSSLSAMSCCLVL